MRIRPGHVTFGGSIVLGLALASCERASAPLPSPGPTSPSPPAITVLRLDLSVPDVIAPGESVQLAAQATKVDGSVENISSQAQWSSSNPNVIDVSPAGVARGGANGEASILARYQNRGASAQILVLPNGTFRVTGRVTEKGFAIRDVMVTVVFGQGEGLTAITDSTGAYSLYGVSGLVRIRATNEGYIDRIVEITVAANRTLDFELTAAPRRSLAGVYTLTISTAACQFATGTLLDSLKSRSYTATVAQDGSVLAVALSGADFITTRGRGDHFHGLVDSHDSVTFLVGDEYYYYFYGGFGQYDLVERITDNSAFVVSGIVSAKATTSGIIGTLNGAVMLAAGTTAPFRQALARCYSSGHAFEMIRK